MADINPNVAFAPLNQEEMEKLWEKVQQMTPEEIAEKEKFYQDKIYKSHSITLQEFMKRKKLWTEVQDTYGADPYFYQVFGSLDPMLSIQFIRDEDIEAVVDSYSEKEITEAGRFRNPTHARLLRKLKDKRYEELKEKNKSK